MNVLVTGQAGISTHGESDEIIDVKDAIRASITYHG